MTVKKYHELVTFLFGNQMLEKCTKEQREFFCRMYPNGVNQKTVMRAIQQVKKYNC